jgi:hypothetical protein
MSFIPYNFKTPDSSTTFVGPPPVSVPPATTDSYCEDLIETYNASILKKFPDDLHQSFLTTAKDCLKKNKRRVVDHQKRKIVYKDRTVLSTLITNLEHEKITPTLPDVGFIEGPMNMSLHWSKKYKKLIYILGERHIGYVKCPEKEIKNTSKIEDYLDKIFTNPIAFIDFYLEIGGFVISDGYPSKFEGQETLDLLRNKFKDCIDTLTRNLITTNCKTSRMHFFDIRQGDIRWGIPLMTQFGNVILSTQANMYNYGLIYYKNLDELRNSEHTCDNTNLTNPFWDFFDFWGFLVEKLADFETQEEYEKFWYEEIYNFEIIKKEINLMHSDVRPYLNWFIQTKLSEYINYKDVKNIATNIINIYLSEDQGQMKRPELRSRYYKKITFKSIMLFYDQLNNFSNICTININSLLSDAYLLARVFKTFKIDDPNKQRLTDEPSEPRNIIIYAGNNHANRCREFLTHIGFKTLEKSGKGFYKDDEIIYDKCIDINKKNVLNKTPTITQPLFNNWPYEIEDIRMTYIDSEELKIYESFNATFNPTNNYFIGKNKLEDKYEGLSDDELEDEDDELKRLGDKYELKATLDDYENSILTDN